MTPPDLKHNHETNNPESHFFDRKTMRFFGDTMANYKVVGPIPVKTPTSEYQAYKLCRKRPVKHGLQSPAYFDAETFKQIHVESEL